MRLFKISALFLITTLLLKSFISNAQDYPNCFLDNDFNDEFVFGIGGLAFCDNLSFQDLAEMSEIELYNYLVNIDIDVDVNRKCFSNKVFYHNEAYSPQLFSASKINYIADQAVMLANNFSGTDNGIYGLIQYFDIAVTQNYNSLNSNYDLPISQLSWNKISTVCTTLSSNPHILNTITDDANIIAGYLFSTCWAGNISTQTEVINLVQNTLFQLAEQQNWKNFITADDEYLYSFYFKNHFLLNTFLFYAFYDYYDTQNPKFIDKLNEIPYDQIITSLSYLACDPEIKNSSIERIAENSIFAAKALGTLSFSIKEEQNYSLYDSHVESELLEVLNCYTYLNPVWVRIAKALIDNGSDIGYDNETIRTDLINQEFSNQNIFEDGKLIMHSSLPNNEVLGLYEALQQVKAQFFRLFELTEQMPVEDDPNEVVQIRIYKNRSSYTSYNNFLFGAPSPAGGVFIENANTLNEDYATIYTWDRNIGESNYTLEELVRHEYVHYLQARYLVKGLWGESVNPFYRDKRLVWFEEGMAEFFTGCTDMNGVIDRNVIKDNIQNRPFISLNQVTKLGYGSNDTYNFGNLIWSNWYKNNRNRFKELASFTRQGTTGINGFDNYLTNATFSDEQNFQDHVNCLKQDACETWTPDTEALDYRQMSTQNVEMLRSEFITNVSNISNVQIQEQYHSEVGRYLLTGLYTANASNSEMQRKLNLYDKLDEILLEIENDSNLNNYNYATAYYSNINTTNNPPTAQLNIAGPLKKETSGVYPGDVNYDGIVNAADVMHLGHYFNQTNTPSNTINISWEPHERVDWNINQSSTYCFYGFEDLKYADCNGDGTINITDLEAIQQNWSNTHSEAPFIQPIIPCFFFDDFSDYQLSLQPIEILDNNNILVNIVIERVSNDPIDFFSGFINATHSDNVSSISINFDDTWFGNPNVDFEYLTNENTLNRTLETGFTKTNGLNSIGTGVIGQIELQLANNNNTNIELYIELGFQNIEKDNLFLQRNYEIHPNFGVQGINNSICDYDDIIISKSTIFQNQYNSNGLIETNGNVNVGKEQVVEYRAERVRLNTGFSVKAGASYKAYYDPCQ